MSPDEVDDHILQKFEDFFLAEVPGEEVAAVIMEPVQGEGGFVIPSVRFVQGVKAFARNTGFCLLPMKCKPGLGGQGKTLRWSTSVLCPI